jgi:hypothetical protein
MIREGRIFGFAIAVLAFATPGMGGDDARKLLTASAAPLEIPHTSKVEFADRAARRRAPARFETSQLLEVTPGLAPLPFPRNSDIRARLLTPELRRTPVLGWVAANLYRNKKDNGWCLELDPGEGEYLVFYRVHLN